MTTASRRRAVGGSPHGGGEFPLLAIYGAFFGLVALVVMLVRGAAQLTDRGSSPGAIAVGVLMLLVVAAVPAVLGLLLGRRRADRAWAPAMVARSRTPFALGSPDLVLTQSPGRLVAAIGTAWAISVGFVVLALGMHPAGWLGVAAGLALAARLTWRLRTRPVLSVSRDGFEIACGWRRVALAWDECAAFTVARRGRVQVTVVVDRGLKPPPLHAIRAGLDGRNAEELAALLSSYLPAGTVRRTG